MDILMCGIVAAAFKSLQPLNLITHSLKLLEYRGYDSAGIAYLNEGTVCTEKVLGKVKLLDDKVNHCPDSRIAMSHTRWATHGKPSMSNAHPQVSHETISVVHNGIIDNYQELKAHLLEKGYTFSSETDTEVIVHLLHLESQSNHNWVETVRSVCQKLEGSYALVVFNLNFPEQLIGISMHSPLVVGVSQLGYFLASDMLALSAHTQDFIYLDEGDIALVTANKCEVLNKNGQEKPIKVHQINTVENVVDLGNHKHYMHKEIYEQERTTRHQLNCYQVEYMDTLYSLKQPNNIHILACGSSYHAGLVAKYWLEEMCNTPCHVEVASEARYRKKVYQDYDLIVSISQSGETADTLAAVKDALKTNPTLQHLCLCNVPESALPRTANAQLFIHSGKEIGVAATKTFTHQLTALLTLSSILCQKSPEIQNSLEQLPGLISDTLKLEPAIIEIAKNLVDSQHLMYLGRNELYPIAIEGALKLKEISYIHAEAYPGGELKHGPLAIIDKSFPTVALVNNDSLKKKMISNLEEIAARGGPIVLITTLDPKEIKLPCLNVLQIPECPQYLAPMIFNIPLQLLAYHIAKLRGLDVDQPRNLAKCVTVE